MISFFNQINRYVHIPGCSFWLGENSPGSRMLAEVADDVLLLLLEEAATDVTTVGCTVAVGGAAATTAAAAAVEEPPGEADRMSGPAGW